MFTVKLRYHLRTRRVLLDAGRNEAIPVMPFNELCDLIGDAIKSVPTEVIKKSFKQTLFSLPADGSRDDIDGSKRLTSLIAQAPEFEDLPEAYRFEVFDTKSFQFWISIEPVDDFGIRRRKKGSAEKYKNRAFKCELCGWGYSNKSHPKVSEHKGDCPAVWIFEEWQRTLLDIGLSEKFFNAFEENGYDDVLFWPELEFFCSVPM